eukprot:CAMPEP_0204495180 /NCGR_PEP_ID=MMETSP0471-20130131/85857_1 /ASSEMBLY_ACC=CAM_ASM_000602 /TAXON_ID=2969 /ORGANISM="Oxyrrhis marina" /LENGTH=64 /DNA_ID=CAMNT_0051499419 /DNA_START=116 /DNA_END=307 /DNA_ORIENTATION=-
MDHSGTSCSGSNTSTLAMTSRPSKPPAAKIKSPWAAAAKPLRATCMDTALRHSLVTRENSSTAD